MNGYQAYSYLDEAVSKKGLAYGATSGALGAAFGATFGKHVLKEKKNLKDAQARGDETEIAAAKKRLKESRIADGTVLGAFGAAGGYKIGSNKDPKYRRSKVNSIKRESPQDDDSDPGYQKFVQFRENNKESIAKVQQEQDRRFQDLARRIREAQEAGKDTTELNNQYQELRKIGSTGNYKKKAEAFGMNIDWK